MIKAPKMSPFIHEKDVRKQSIKHSNFHLEIKSYGCTLSSKLLQHCRDKKQQMRDWEEPCHYNEESPQFLPFALQWFKKSIFTSLAIIAQNCFIILPCVTIPLQWVRDIYCCIPFSPISGIDVLHFTPWWWHTTTRLEIAPKWEIFRWVF